MYTFSLAIAAAYFDAGATLATATPSGTGGAAESVGQNSTPSAPMSPAVVASASGFQSRGASDSVLPRALRATAAVYSSAVNTSEPGIRPGRTSARSTGAAKEAGHQLRAR